MNNWKFKWNTKNGKIVRIVDMDNDHLINTIKFIQRISEFKLSEMQKGLFKYGRPNGEQAEVDLEQAENQVMSMTWEDMLDDYPAYPKMVKEADKRGLEYPNKVKP